MPTDDALLQALAEIRDIADNAHTLHKGDMARALQACADIATEAIGTHWHLTHA